MNKLSLWGCGGRAELPLAYTGCRFEAHGELLLQSRCVVKCLWGRSLRGVEAAALGVL